MLIDLLAAIATAEPVAAKVPGPVLAKLKRLGVFDARLGVRKFEASQAIAAANLLARLPWHGGCGNVDAALLDAFKAHFGYGTDTALGEFLGIKKATITNIRKGRAGLSDISRLRMLGKIDEKFDAALYKAALQSNGMIEQLLDVAIEAKGAHLHQRQPPQTLGMPLASPPGA